MRRTSFSDMSCSIAQCLEVIGDWWTPLIIRDLFMGVTRFDDFQSRLGISRNILTERLAHLVEMEIVERVLYQKRPDRFEYRLTHKGADLWRVMTAMREWGDRWAAPDGAPVVTMHEPCGHETEMAVSCAECGEPLRPRDLRVVPGPGVTADTPLPIPPPARD